MTSLANATSWWVPKLVSGTNLVDQKGSNTLVSVNTPTLTNDGTYNISQLRAASTQYYAAFDAASLDADAGDYSIVLVTKPQVNLTGTKILYAKRFQANLGYNLFTSTSTPSTVFDDDVASPVTATAPGVSTGTRYTLAVVKSGTSLRMVRDGTPGTSQTVSSNTIANGEDLRINRGSGTTTNYSDQDLYGIAWFKGIALTDAETVSIGNELLAATAIANLVTGTASSVSASAGTATGKVTVKATAASVSGSAGSATGKRIVNASAASSSGSAGAATGLRTVNATAASVSASTGTASGTPFVLGVGSSVSTSDGGATGQRTVIAAGDGTCASDGHADGTRVCPGAASEQSTSDGAAQGTRIVLGTGSEVSGSDGHADAGGFVSGSGSSTSTSGGAAAGTVIRHGTAASVSTSLGGANGSVTRHGSGFGSSGSAGAAIGVVTVHGTGTEQSGSDGQAIGTGGVPAVFPPVHRFYVTDNRRTYASDARRAYVSDARRTYLDA